MLSQAPPLNRIFWWQVQAILEILYPDKRAAYTRGVLPRHLRVPVLQRSAVDSVASDSRGTDYEDIVLQRPRSIFPQYAPFSFDLGIAERTNAVVWGNLVHRSADGIPVIT